VVLVLVLVLVWGRCGLSVVWQAIFTASHWF